MDDAIRAFKRAHENDPTNVSYMIKLGDFLIRKNSEKAATKILKGATKLAPGNAETWLYLGIAFHQFKHLDEAKIAYEKAFDIAPELSQVSTNLGAIGMEVGDWEEALKYFEKVVDLNPDQPEGYNNLGLSLKNLNRLEEAKNWIVKAIEAKPDFADAHTNLGNVYKELEELREAELCYQRAINLNPLSMEAHNNLGTTLSELARLEKAQYHLKRATELEPKSAEPHDNLGNVLKDLGLVKEAEISYRKAISINPDLTTAHRNLGFLLRDEGKMHQAVSSFQKALSTRSNLVLAEDDELSPATNGIFFELTNKCNFHCVFCPSDDQKRDLGQMDFELVKRLYKETSDKKIAPSVNLHLMGEPTLHPKLIDILEYGSSVNVKTSLVTNGSTLVSKIVPKILNSLYGEIVASHMTPTEESYHLRGKVGLSWERYISNIQLLVREYMKLRATPGVVTKNKLVIRVMVTQDTASNVSVIESDSEARAILKEWNDYVTEVEQELDMIPFERKNHTAANLLRGNDPAFTNYHLQNGITLQFWKAFTFANSRVSDDFKLEVSKETAYCPKPFTDLGVLWNGDVTLCSLDHDGELKVGNIRNSSIETVIQSESAKKLRSSMLGYRPLPSICQNCQAKPVKRS